MRLRLDSAVDAAETAPPASTVSRRGEMNALGRAAIAGDQAALEKLLRSLGPDILRVARAVLGHKHPDLDDLVQECLLGFVRALSQFRFESSVSTFALTITFRHALTAKRRQRDVQRWIGTFQRLQEPLMDEGPSPARALEIERRRALVAGMLTTIPKPQAEALGLRVVVGLSVEQIAEMTATPVNTVRSRLRLAKGSLRKTIESDAALADFLEPIE
ncbi:MAG TPA: RNA polymerase sigma factor [Polyangia bacterium]|nr:RNA polymerase sigma factor [Polyangia bacterium]